MIVDGHLDLATNGLQLRRNLTLTADEVRRADSAELKKAYGTCTVTFPELRRGEVGLVVTTIMTHLNAGGGSAGTGMRTQEQCYAIGRSHVAYYEIMERAGHLRIIRTLRDLNDLIGAWGVPDESEPIGMIMTMEGADPIVDPDQIPEWYELGVRIVALAYAGKGAYAHGTGAQGGLLPSATALLAGLQEAGIILDVTHLADQGFKEVMERWDGPVIASHHNCRALVAGQRQLTDEMIGQLIERDGIIGTCFALWMLDPKLNTSKPERTKDLEAVVDHIDHICQIAGNSRHASIGSDLDGGFGLEMSPGGMETIGDLPRVGELLAARGYTTDDVANILSDNWIRVLSDVLK